MPYNLPDVDFLNPWEDEQDNFFPSFSFNQRPQAPEVSIPPNFNPELFNEPELSNKALDAYNQHIANVPMPDNYKPSIWRKLGATLAGTFAGSPERAYAQAAGIVRAPYDNALEVWDRKAKSLAASANIEAKSNDDNARRRSLFLQALKEFRDQQSQNLQDTERQLNIRTKTKELEQMGYQKHVDENGVEWMVNPFDGQRIQIGRTNAVTPGERQKDRDQDWRIAQYLEGGRNTRATLDRNQSLEIAKNAQNLRAQALRDVNIRNVLDRVSISYPYFRSALQKASEGQELTPEEQIAYQEGYEAYIKLLRQSPTVTPPTWSK